VFQRSKKRVGGVSVSTLIGIVFISFCAFFGFRTLFSDLNQNIGVEALAAAFGALFVLLPTKILMDQETENHIEGQKKTTIFNQRLQAYRKIGEVMFKVLEDGKIEVNELNNLRTVSIDLMILGSKDAIDQCLQFTESCTALVVKDGGEYRDVVLNSSQYAELLIPGLKFYQYARESLNISDDDFYMQEKWITRIQEMSTTVENLKPTARQPLKGGFNEWSRMREYSVNEQESLKRLIDTIKELNPNVIEKYTKSAISFSNSKLKKNVFYIDYIVKKNSIKTIKCGLPLISKDDSELCENIKDILIGVDGINLRVGEYRDGLQLGYGMNIDLTNKVTFASNLKKIANAIGIYADRMIEKNLAVPNTFTAKKNKSIGRFSD
jgi:hypothetical protein